MRYSLILLALLAVACSKSSKTEGDMKRNLTVSYQNYSQYWEVWLTLDKGATMTGSIIVQHDLWYTGTFQKTFIDTFDYSFNQHYFFNYKTKRIGGGAPGYEAKNIRVNKFNQATGNYNVTIVNQ